MYVCTSCLKSGRVERALIRHIIIGNNDTGKSGSVNSDPFLCHCFYVSRKKHNTASLFFFLTTAKKPISDKAETK